MEFSGPHKYINNSYSELHYHYSLEIGDFNDKFHLFMPYLLLVYYHYYSNSDASASELLENLEEMCPQYSMVNNSKKSKNK